MRNKKPQTVFFFNVLGINDSDSWNLKEEKKMKSYNNITARYAGQWQDVKKKKKKSCLYSIIVIRQIRWQTSSSGSRVTVSLWFTDCGLTKKTTTVMITETWAGIGCQWWLVRDRAAPAKPSKQNDLSFLFLNIFISSFAVFGFFFLENDKNTM